MIIKTNNLKRTYVTGTQSVDAIKGIDLEIQRGEFLSIMGPSGSGKTTLMNIIGCLDTATSGTYYLNDKLVNNLSDDDCQKFEIKKLVLYFNHFIYLLEILH